MYIKEIVIDGFKSYAQRTVVSGFDPLFNAITGLNGSGKSNILDSICFLLGISNLSQVRAGSLQELVYKSGQAGVTKATVTITFDNTDKKQSPVGYESYDEITVSRQVVIGGRNKYLINGSNASNTRVQDLFHSVGLNINNPHFLIMQGRITKVLNMKPPEILSMIEEAAGTRMYESKKQSAQKTIEKKDAKLNEINTILEEEISPTLTRLKEERSNYLEYQKVLREIEHLSRMHVAYQFFCAEETQKRSAEDLAEITENIQQFQKRQQEIDQQIAKLNEAVQELEKKRDEETGGQIQTLEGRLSEEQKADAKAQSSLDNKKETLNSEKKKKKDITKSIDEDHAALKAKEKEVEKLAAAQQKLENQAKEDTDAHTAAQKHFQAVSAGLSSNDEGEDATLAEQMMAAKDEISQVDTDTKQAQMKLKHAEEEVKKKRAELKKTEKSYEKDKTAYEAIQKNQEKLEAEMKKLGYEEGKEERLLEQKRGLQEAVSNLQEKVETLQARFPNLDFEYRDPEKNWDRSRVKGLVAQLITVKDVKHAMALEVAAGNKLYNVIVDNEVTGKKIIDKGQLKRRFTIIPLTKISSRVLSNDTLKQAQNLVGKDSAKVALSLVGYENEVKAAVSFVFGSTLVCDTLDNAKKVTFDKKVMTRSVTLDGDSFEPAGLLSGGAVQKRESVLAKLNEYKAATEELQQKQQQLAAVEKELQGIKKVVDKYRGLKEQYDMKTHEAELLKTRLEQSTHHKQLEDIQGLEQTIEEGKQVLAGAKDRQKKAADKVKELEKKMKEAQQHREKELKEAEKNVGKAKEKAEKSSKQMREKGQELEAVKLEAEELKKEISGYEDQMKAVDQAIAGYEEQVEELKKKAAETKKCVEAAQAELNQAREVLRECNKEIGERNKEAKELDKEKNEAQLKIQELEHKVNKHNKDSKDAAKSVEHMLNKYEWIASDRKFFNQPNTPYDFKANNPKEAGRRLQKLEETKDKLSKNVNMRAMNMLGKAEEKYNDLMKRKRIVENDKAKIQTVIQELDKKKNEALKKAWEQVNKDFGSIYSTLLPGTDAKLAPPEGQTVLQGLEVKVAFGDVWKESLSELSGGQRSLVALSLILAMLLFKPAPIYILDEVDAALDLSHTQNIGRMIKSHFKHSQFIVVSLKDGMFNNANVLYKTKFVDGVSTVTRYAQGNPTSRPVQAAGTGEGVLEDGRAKKKRRGAAAGGMA
ncbi:PREDICTED: structural maintenance of chromosomes protein 2-like [Branchiostoma belcheri]|uniref:Structural maintenance of chromosomes protein n=1 Tax=Branchiostoma belcheri TaxID=7741 RepID=A0A6P5A7D3_BRABE|nr:PREDICTED: structural maintenance of chromosomes protein 2-like [Branchiostoma belcheri]